MNLPQPPPPADSEILAIEVLPGADATRNPALMASLGNLWAHAYRNSPVAAQSADPLFASEHRDERLRRIRAELDNASAVLAFAAKDKDLVGFFWGLSVADLQRIEPDKANNIAPFVTHPTEQVAYLSMLGIHPDQRSQGLGKRLTRALCAAFADRGASEAVARTINELALQKVYMPLGFKLYTRFRDPRSQNADRFIFGSLLPLL